MTISVTYNNKAENFIVRPPLRFLDTRLIIYDSVFNSNCLDRWFVSSCMALLLLLNCNPVHRRPLLMQQSLPTIDKSASSNTALSIPSGALFAIRVQHVAYHHLSLKAALPFKCWCTYYCISHCVNNLSVHMVVGSEYSKAWSLSCSARRLRNP